MPVLRPRPLVGLLLAASVALSVVSCSPQTAPAPSAPTTAAAPSPSATPSPSPSPTFDKAQYSLDDPGSQWVVTNKTRPLHPLAYEPELVVAKVRHIFTPLMRSDAAAALALMFAAGQREGAGAMQVQNSYRSYSVQVQVHEAQVARYGKAVADAQSARPGFSEHQTGFALDIATLPSRCEIQECFGATPQGKWLAANAYRFGFILRYPAGKQAITGYIYEPWHFRYVGVDLAEEMHRTGVTTLEEFFGLPAAPDYR